METLEIASQLVALCKEGKNLDAVNSLYSDDVVSIEGSSQGGTPQRMEGIEAIRGKHEWWYSNHEIHEVRTEGPFCAEGDDSFGVHFFLDVTPKAGGERMKMNEIGLYKVADGKIVEERFFYQMG